MRERDLCRDLKPSPHGSGAPRLSKSGVPVGVHPRPQGWALTARGKLRGPSAARPLPRMLGRGPVRDAGAPDRKPGTNAAAEARDCLARSVDLITLSSSAMSCWRGHPRRACLSGPACCGPMRRGPGGSGSGIEGDPGRCPPLATLLKSNRALPGDYFRLDCPRLGRTPASAQSARVGLRPPPPGDGGQPLTGPCNRPDPRAPVARPAGTCRLERNCSIGASTPGRPTPPPPTSGGSWSSGATAAQGRWRPCPPACASRSTGLRQPWIKRCRPETSWPSPRSAEAEAMQTAVPTPPRAFHPLAALAAWQAAPGAGAGAGSKQPARIPASRKRLPPKPNFHRRVRGITPPAKPLDALELEALPRHDRPRLNTSPLPSATPRPHPRPWWNTGWAGAAGGAAGCWCRGRRSSGPAQRGCQELWRPLKHEGPRFWKRGVDRQQRPAGRGQHAPFKHSSEQGQAQQLGQEGSVPASRPPCSQESPAQVALAANRCGRRAWLPSTDA